SGKEKRIEFMSPFTKIWVDYFILPQKNKKGQVESLITFSRDITDLKGYEKELRFKQEQLEFALDFAQLAYWELSLDSGTFLLSPQLANLLGYPAGEVPKIIHMEDFIKSKVLKEDRPKWVQEWKNVSKKRIDRVFIEYRIMKGKKVRSLISNGIVVSPERGKDDKIYVITQDVTELREKEEELRVKQELQTLTFEFAQLAYWEITLPNKRVKVNLSLASLFGIPYEDKEFSMPLEEVVEKYIIEEDHESFWAGYGLLFNKKAGKASAQFRTLRNGEIRQLKASAILIRDKSGQAIMVSGITQDITELKHREIELREKQNLLTLTLEFARLAYWEIFLPAIELKIDPPVARLFGIPEEKIGLIMSVEELKRDYYFPEDIGKVSKALDPLYAGNIEKASVEFRINRKGELRNLRSSAILVRDEKGKILRVSGLSQDITDLRKKEEELRMYQDKLELMVKQRTAALERSHEYFKLAMKMARIWKWQFDISTKEITIDKEFASLFNLNIEKQTDEGQVVIPWEKWVKITVPEDLSRTLEGIKETSWKEGLLRFILPSGGMMNIYYQSRAIFDPHKRKIVKRFGIGQDLTNIRRIEMEKERLQGIIESTSDIIAIVDAKGVPIYINQAGFSFYGVASLPEFANLQSDEERLNISHLILHEGMDYAIENGVWKGENKLVNKYGETIPVSQVVIAHKSLEGQIDCISTIIRDMSEQKQIEKELIFKNKELDTFLYKAYHDLRGPVSTLKGLHTVVTHDIKDKQALSIFNMYDMEANKLHQIIQSIIELSKVKEVSFKK
ncbi:PAS domain-containing protein, partial [Xanthovirga aplysinae]|uniref:PAS domain-containing protein n=1 Tax=Xanthovirga aplysinae TaxID=2529853 RepID=UPI0012BBEF58